jgi:catechol 2,3-dioxygenase-like lactoylglutathione lyase family enzyme
MSDGSAGRDGSSTPGAWAAHLPVTAVRWARPTDRLEEVEAFYVDGLGLTRLGGFEGHVGYSGVFVGLPGEGVHLEFTSHSDGSPCPAPTADNLLVLYLADRAAVDAVAERLARRGHPAVEPENPYWLPRSVTVEDPDGWRVVLVDASYPA